jgi:chromosome segregation ATPase
MDSVMASFEQIDALKKEFSAAKANNDTLRATEISKLIIAKFDSSDQHIRKLDARLANANSKTKALRKVVANLKSQLYEAKAEVAVLEGKVADLKNTVEAQEQMILSKESEIGETKGENAALNANLRETQKKAFLEKGDALIERGQQAEKNGDGLSGLINGKKKKAQYLQAAEFYQKAIDHFNTIPGGIGGFSDDQAERKVFEQKQQDAQKALDAINAKMK